MRYHYQLSWQVGLLHAGGEISCRPHSADMQLAVVAAAAACSGLATHFVNCISRPLMHLLVSINSILYGLYNNNNNNNNNKDICNALNSPKDEKKHTYLLCSLAYTCISRRCINRKWTRLIRPVQYLIQGLLSSNKIK